jgi:cytochrome c oxidase subunit 2
VRVLPLVAVAVVLAGCGSKQNTLAPEGPQAKSVASLWWWLMGGAWVGLAVVCGLLVLAWVKRNRMGPGRVPDEKLGCVVVIWLGVAVMVVVLVAVFVVGDLDVLDETAAPAATKTDLTVRAIGHQWYWEFDYPATPHAVTANELHIPVRTPVRVVATTADVIHSFWVPELNRKIDTIPGQTNSIELYADRPGRYRGQCNQFCGLQHAHMGFYVFAEPPAQFRAWLAKQAQPARAPTSPAARSGERVFMQGPCSSCHTIRGTEADGYVGPDLTHLASRTSLAGLVLPNTQDALERWVMDAQDVKPGNQMPDVNLTRRQLTQVVAYLESLK